MAGQSATAASAAAPRRTRLTPEREREICRAVLDLTREDGYEALTMDAVAARTKSSKATLYRQWESKPNLVACALRAEQRVTIDDIDSGTLPGDLHEMLRRIADDVDRDAELLSGLAHAMERDEELGRTVRAVLIEPELRSLDTMLARAVDRGEVAEGNPALEFVPHLLVAALVTRRLTDGRKPDAAYMERYVDSVILPVLLTA